MRKIPTAEISAFLLFGLFFFGGIASIFNIFLAQSAPLSFSNPFWMVIVSGYLFTQIALVAHQVFHLRGSTKTIPLPIWWKTSPIFQATAVVAILLLVGFFLSATPIERLLVHTLNSFWLNFPLALFSIIVIKTLFKNGRAGGIELFDLINAGILYFCFFFAAPILVYYPETNRALIIICAVLISLAYIDLPITEKILIRFKSKRIANFSLAFLFFVSMIGFLYFCINGMFITTSIMDEGSYSIKGTLFATGEYFPYQDFGPWTNKMPFAFMIPGWIQFFFGPSLLAIRVAALVMQIVTAFSLFLIGRRFFGYKGGVIAFALFALNPALPSFYSQGNTQVVSVFLISLVMLFTLGKDRGTLSLLVGNIIAGVLLLARENMAPFVVFLNLYLIWEQGWKRAILPIASGWLVFIGGHIYYWPGILKVWAKWMPKEITPFLDEFRNKGGGKLMWKREGRNTDLITSLGSLTQGISSNLVNMIATFALPFLLKSRRSLTKLPFFKVTVFLWGSVVFLTIIHAIITLNDGSCVYCFSSYLSFFTPMAIILFVLTLSAISENSSLTSKIVFISIIGLFFTAEWYNRRQDLRWLTQLRLTSILNPSGFQFLSDLLESSFRISYEVSKSLVPVFFGLGIFMLVLALIYWLWRKWLFGRCPSTTITSAIALFGISLPMVANLIFYTALPKDCKSNIPVAYAAATDHVSSVVPEGKKIFWLGESTAVLLGLNNKFYPQQFNEGFSYKVGSVDESAERYGFWNENLARKWSEDTDFMLIEENKMNNPILENVNFSNFKEISQTPLVNGCDPTSFYHIYKRIR